MTEYKMPNFKRTKFYVANNDEAERVQKAMFALGFMWIYKPKGAVRQVNYWFPSGGWLFVDENCRIKWSTYDNALCFKAAFQDALFAAADEHKKWKKAQKKAQRKRSKLRKQGWITWNGAGVNECPVPGATIQVKFSDMQSSGQAQLADDFAWNHVGTADIVAYRVVKPTVTLPEPTNSWGTLTTGLNPCVGLLDEVAPATVFTDTNPKKQFGLASIPLNLWSTLASAYGALGLYNGSLKYGTANFANTKVEASIYIAAAQRHLAAWAAGEEFDPADGVPNLGGVLANVAIILEARAAGTLIDDRPKMSGYLKEREALKEIVKGLNELHAGKTPHHYTMGEN